MDLFGGPIMHQCAKFRVDLLNLCRDIAVFRFFKNGGRPPSWIFECTKFYVSVRYRRPICVSMPMFVPIGWTFLEIWFSISAILDLFYVYLDRPRRVSVGLCHCTKFGWNRCSNFDNYVSFNVLRVWLVNAYSGFFLGGFWGMQYQPSPKSYISGSYRF